MSTFIDSDYITEMGCGSNFAYILNDNGMFLSTEYKVLQSQSDSCFVKCMKMLYNGKTQLYYLTGTLKPFAMMFSSMDAESFLTIVANIFADIIDVKHNGFLSCQNIDISFDKIYVDPATYKVSLVYLPLSKKIFDDNSSFENEVRTRLVKLISGTTTLSSPKTMQLCMDLSDGTLTIEDLYSRLKGGASTGKTSQVSPGKETGSKTLKIVAMNAPERVEILVTKDEFVIGKKPELCDGVVSFNKMISRSHCKVCRSGLQWSVVDLQSANGTYINGMRLQPNQAHPIKNGDVIRMANSDFQVMMG